MHKHKHKMYFIYAIFKKKKNLTTTFGIRPSVWFLFSFGHKFSIWCIPSINKHLRFFTTPCLPTRHLQLFLCLPLLLWFQAVGFIYFLVQNALRSTSFRLFGSLDSPLGSFASEPRPTFSGGPDFACLVHTRVQMSFHTCPKKQTIWGNELWFGPNSASVKAP